MARFNFPGTLIPDQAFASQMTERRLLFIFPN